MIQRPVNCALSDEKLPVDLNQRELLHASEGVVVVQILHELGLALNNYRSKLVFRLDSLREVAQYVPEGSLENRPEETLAYFADDAALGFKVRENDHVAKAVFEVVVISEQVVV